MRGASLMLAVFLVLGSASVAAAECAWVLWTRYVGDWVVKASTSTREECEARRLDIARNLLPEKDAEAVLRLWEREVGLRYICLPDTIDPREKKE